MALDFISERFSQLSSSVRSEMSSILGNEHNWQEKKTEVQTLDGGGGGGGGNSVHQKKGLVRYDIQQQ
jgi:hypothetical protein